MPVSLIDFSSPSWLHLAEFARERIEAHRRSNEGDLDPVETARVRGQIKALKELLGLPERVARERETPPDNPFGLPPSS